MGDEVDFYASPGAMSDLRGYDEALVGMPSDATTTWRPSCRA